MATPSGLSFLQSIVGYTQHVGLAENPSANAPMRLAVIDVSYDPAEYPVTLPRVLFEGEDTIGDKRYPVMPRDYVPGPGDRVVMLPVGHTYIIIGCLFPSFQPNLQRADLGRRIYMDGESVINATSGQVGTSTVVSIGATMPNTSYRVFLQNYQAGGTNSYVFQVTARTTTTFTVEWRKPDNTAFGSTTTTTVHWMLICTP